MGEVLKNRLKISKDIPLREEVDLNLRIASSVIYGRFEKIIEPKFNITETQYNVLRILKGVYPNGHARCEIASRMIERASDITRIIDRLEKQGLVKRDRTTKDRRISITRITKKGLKVVNDIKPLIENEHKLITKNLTENECKELSRLTEKLYKNLI